MTQTPAVAVIHRFPGWELRPQERALLVRGEPVKIGARAFDLLLALAERQGRVVSKDELLDVAWPGLVVEENNLSVQITTLRKLLGPGAIATVAGYGYRLAAVPEVAVAQAVAADVTRQPFALLPELFGREADLAALLGVVGIVPLVSIVGAGGVGKTSLAKALIARTPAPWRDGVHWIDLAPFRDGAPLMKLVARSLGIALEDPGQTQEDFVSHLSQLQALIAVDNCEHLLDEVAAFVGSALQQAPSIRWLATSLEPLHLPAESVYRLEPLDIPEPGAELGQAMTCGALGLFCERARAADRHFELEAQDLETAVELCRQLDGLPLAIEMAAARVARFGLSGVREQLGPRLRLRAGTRDAPSRHHTLLQTFEWSYGLLTPTEQRLFRRLQPFLGGFSAPMAQRICSGPGGDPESVDEWQANDALQALVDKSLVQRSRTHPGRFHLLETARDYARALLEAAHELDAVRRRHAEVVADWFDAAHADFQHVRDQVWSARCMPDHHNVRAALDWAAGAREPDLLARLVAALAQFDLIAHAQPELAQCAIPLDVLDAAAPPLRAHAYLECGWANYLGGSRETGTALALQALADFESMHDAVGIYRALARLIRLYEGRPGMLDKAGEHWARLQQIDEGPLPLRTRLACTISAGLQHGGRTISRLQELHEIAQRSGFDAMAAVCRTHITDELLIQGRFEEAVETARSMLDRDQSLPRERALICHNQALALVQLGRVEDAKAPARAMLRALPGAAHMVVDMFALATARAGQFVDAALMAGFSVEVKRARDLRSDPAEAAVVAETLERLQAGLNAERLSELLRVGAAMSGADVLAMALRAA